MLAAANKDSFCYVSFFTPDVLFSMSVIFIPHTGMKKAVSLC